MSHYEERLERDITRIRSHVDALAASVVEAMKNSVHALLTGNEKLASTVVLADGPINRSMREIDAMCHSFIAVHLPSGRHLRLISSVIRINITLERIGDYAVTIARELLQLESKPDGEVARGVEMMSNETMGVFLQALEAFKKDDADLAKETMKLASRTVSSFNQMLAALVEEQDKRGITDLFALFVVFHHLVRVSDQSKNICEDTVFAVTGETKAKKIYKVLFLDEDNACLSQMAQAIASKSHAEGGVFVSAGRHPSSALHSGLMDFMDERGIDLESSKLQSVDAVKDQLEDFHVIVSLQGSARSYIDKVPFHTTLLDWDVGEAPAEGDSGQAAQRFEEIYRELALQIQDLMVLLRGEESSQALS